MKHTEALCRTDAVVFNQTSFIGHLKIIGQKTIFEV